MSKRACIGGCDTSVDDVPKAWCGKRECAFRYERARINDSSSIDRGINRMWAHLQHARWLLEPCRLRDSIDNAIRFEFDQNEVPGVSPTDTLYGVAEVAALRAERDGAVAANIRMQGEPKHAAHMRAERAVNEAQGALDLLHRMAESLRVETAFTGGSVGTSHNLAAYDRMFPNGAPTDA